MPYSEPTESALIARLLVDPKPIPTLTLDAEDFHIRRYRTAYKAMLALTAAGKPIDLVTLRDSGVDLSSVLDTITTGHTAPVEQYASLIRRDAMRRRYISILNDLAARAEEEDDPRALIAALQDETAKLAEGIEIQDTLGRVNLADYTATPEPPYFGIASPVGTTVIYGDGGDGKGWVVAKLVAMLHGAGIKVCVLDFEMQSAEWGYRLGLFGVDLHDIAYFAPPTTFDRWATEASAQLLRAEGIGFLVVDSAMYASDQDDPYSPNGALAYGRARRRLNNLPSLLLAHTTGGADKIFGSVYWRNECRTSWRLYKDDKTNKRYMICRKANGYSWLEGVRYDINFSEEAGTLNMVQA